MNGSFIHSPSVMYALSIVTMMPPVYDPNVVVGAAICGLIFVETHLLGLSRNKWADCSTRSHLWAHRKMSHPGRSFRDPLEVGRRSALDANQKPESEHLKHA
jgi:hypothetical protein